ncbi:MAG: hypothetical protein OXN89_02585 [Bryobacterales bacterium]|nr:hypothetical protein [Bryobacterales bacterium]
MLTRGCHRTYHKMSPKHLDRYVTGFAARHDVREADTIDQMEHFALGMEGTRLKIGPKVTEELLESGRRKRAISRSD